MMNKVIFIGRLTKEPTFRQGEKMPIANFSIAIDRYVKDGEKQTDFPRVTVFGKTAENASKYLKKGSLVSVEGSVRTGSFERDGVKVFTTDFIGERITFLDYRKDKAEDEVISDEEELPFGM